MNDTEISTPESTPAVETSIEVEPEIQQTSSESDNKKSVSSIPEPEIVSSDNNLKQGTSTSEPTASDMTAETETKAEPEVKLYAGKYKSVEELEKGYSEAQKFVTKASELEKKYNKLKELQDFQKEQELASRLEMAQKKGYESVEQQDIHEKVLKNELDLYRRNKDLVEPEKLKEATELLESYYRTGKKSYLDKAKRFYPTEFVETVAINSKELENMLTKDLKNRQYQAEQKNQQRLGEELRGIYKEFLSDLSENEGKEQALRIFANMGAIHSAQDMQMFQTIYDQIAKYERARAMAEQKAQQEIDATKQKSVISSDTTANTVESKIPTRAEMISNPKLYGEAVKKWGASKVDAIIMKG